MMTEEQRVKAQQERLEQVKREMAARGIGLGNPHWKYVRADHTQQSGILAKVAAPKHN